MAKGKLLIVEDDAIISEDIKCKLSDLGFETVGISLSADDAVKKTKELKPDLITMDIMLMEEKTGIAAAIEIREFSNVPILYITAVDERDLLFMVRDTSPFQIIIKPIRKPELKNCVDRLFNKKSTNSKE